MRKQNVLHFALYIISMLMGIMGMTQVAINTDNSAPHPSAMLDIKSSNKVIFIPQVSLTGVTDVVTIPSPAVSLLVYNTNINIDRTYSLRYSDFVVPLVKAVQEQHQQIEDLKKENTSVKQMLEELKKEIELLKNNIASPTSPS